MTDFNIQLVGEEQQQGFGETLGQLVVPPCVIHLQGDLGAGKTTMVRGMLRGRGYNGAVRSPTYTLIEPYPLPETTLYHLDLYRIGDSEELEYLGFRDILAEAAVIVIEWPERATDYLPEPDIRIELSHVAGGRNVDMCGISATGKQLINKLQQHFSHL
ncbi:MAG: tRNA (adenosine(37)-N6)-threonylcarbamoyltransferase complex ATPase subunit type 1 TsaE [bacterium]